MVAERDEGRLSLVAESPIRWRIERHGSMRVPGIVFASDALLRQEGFDRVLRQVANVATLPGIVEASYAMPDVHFGYGFPIGGVAATDVDRDGVVSPGGVGFDISCGVRLLVSRSVEERLAPELSRLMDLLDRSVPRGMGKGGRWTVSERELEGILAGGVRYAVEQGRGVARDVERCEGAVGVVDADPSAVSAEARSRGRHQVGSLGAGNHFLEVQVVDAIHDPEVAAAFGLVPGRICVMIHSGSRGLGHQVCADHVAAMESAMARFRIHVPDRQLACVPVGSSEGRAYLGAMAAAANFGRVNRQLLAEAAREAFARVIGDELELLYDVSHNLATLESHEVGGQSRSLCVQRKGATRALPPGHADLPEDLRATGQPVLLPGSMGTASYVLVGVAGGPAFHSVAHGAGRVMSRHQASRRIRGNVLRDQLEAAGIAVRPGSSRGLAEEAPFAYKDVDEVVEICERAGLGRRVARLRPIGVVKG